MRASRLERPPLSSSLSRLLQVRTGELQLVVLAFLHSLFLGLAYVFSTAAAAALFLTEFDIAQLPWVYVIGLLVVAVCGYAFSRLGERIAPGALFVSIVVLVTVSIAVFRLTLALPGTRGTTFALMVWIEVVGTLISLEFWGLCTWLFSVRQAKRLFGLIGAGTLLGAIAGGVFVSTAVRLVGTPNLLLLSVAGFAVSLIPLFAILRQDTGGVEEEAEEAEEEHGTAAGLLKDRYLLLIGGLMIAGTIASYFIEYAFYEQVELRYVNQNELAAFLGIFGSVENLLALILRILVCGAVLTRFGVKAGLLALPLSLVGVVALSVVTGSFDWGLPAFFWAILAVRLVHGAVSSSIDEPAYYVLFQPLVARIRLKVQSLFEGRIEPLVGAVAGLALIVLNWFFPVKAIHVAWVVAAVLPLWIATVLLLGREYMAVLMKALSGRRLRATALSFVDRDSIAIIEKSLESPHPGEVLYAVHLLGDSESETLRTVLVRLLEHPRSIVRREALGRIEELHLSAARKRVSHLLDQDQDGGVRSRALRTLCALSDPPPLDRVTPYLTHWDLEIRRGAVVALLRYGGIEGILVAGKVLQQLVESPDPANRGLAAEVVGDVGIQSFYRPLLVLLADSQTAVRRSAISAAGRLRNPKLWPPIIDALRDPATRQTAAASLVQGGQGVMPWLAEQAGRDGLNGQLLVQLCRICGRIKGPAAIGLLVAHMEERDHEVQTAALTALTSCRYAPAAHEHPRLRRLMVEEVRLATRFLAARSDLDPVVMEARLLVDALGHEVGKCRQRIFSLLSFVHPHGIIQRLRDNIDSPLAEKREVALETLDTLLRGDLKAAVLPLFDSVSEPETLANLRRRFLESELSVADRLAEVLTERPPETSIWTRACAVFAAGTLAIDELRGTIREILYDDHTVLRETASWTLRSLDPSGDEGPGEGGTSLLTIEKVLFLKSVDLFNRIPDEDLAWIAEVAEKVHFDAGERFIEQGDPGDSLYVTIAGEVDIVVDGVGKIATRGERSVNGEMAILSYSLRTASCVAATEVDALKITRGQFLELLREHPDLGLSIIEVLVRRLDEKSR